MERKEGRVGREGGGKNKGGRRWKFTPFCGTCMRALIVTNSACTPTFEILSPPPCPELA